MTHLTAVSGSNLAIVIGFVMLLARWSRAGPRLAAAAGALAILGFVILVRPEPSVLRAALMGGLGLVALALHRPRAAVPGLAAAGFVLLLSDPSLAVQLGFVLSVLATLGLLLWAPPWREALRRRGVPAGVAEIVAVSTAADLACAPVIAGFTGSVGLAAIPANVLAEPAVAPATVLGVGAAVLSPVSPTGAHLLAWLASWPCRWLVLVARYSAQAPAALLPWPGGTSGALLLAGVLLALVTLTVHPAVRRVALVVAVSAVLAAVPVRWVTGGWPPAGWMFVACDVGQGDGLVLNAAPGQAVVVDTGPEPTAIDRCLRTLGIRSVPLLVLTHDDADHISGITGVFDSRQVEAVAVSRYGAGSSGRRRVVTVANAHGLTPFPVLPGWSYQAGALDIQALVPPEPITGTESDSNNNCVVLRVTGRGTSVLLTGDAGPEEQRALRESGADLHADVLKVPHHGSAYQDPGFASAVAPRVAVISVGENDYGQPSGTVLRRLQRSGIRVLRTDRDGDVAVTAAGGQLAVARHEPPGRSPP
jgi:competence protein ComEC